MPSSQHPVFSWPSDTSVRIWRYMDFTKFVSMLESNSLFFTRADCFEDPFEGSYSKANENMRSRVYPDIPSEALAQMSEFSKWVRQWTFVNCWHMSECESAGMWKLYAHSNEALCVQSTFKRLHECLDERTHLGQVQYVNYATQWLPEGNTLYPYVHKRKSFEHEREIRAVKQEPPFVSDGVDYTAIPPSGGVLQAVDLNHLVEAIYVAPSAPKWLHDLTGKVVDRYGLDKPVIRSSLDDAPFY
jgi:hypothetical protein